jgi:hypothetical protein
LLKVVVVVAAAAAVVVGAVARARTREHTCLWI